MNLIQLDLFKTIQESEIDHLRMTIEEVKKSSDKVRRGIYAKLSEVTKQCNELNSRFEIMEKNICKGV